VSKIAGVKTFHYLFHFSIDYNKQM